MILLSCSIIPNQNLAFLSIDRHILAGNPEQKTTISCINTYDKIAWWWHPKGKGWHLRWTMLVIRWLNSELNFDNPDLTSEVLQNIFWVSDALKVIAWKFKLVAHEIFLIRNFCIFLLQLKLQQPANQCDQKNCQMSIKVAQNDRFWHLYKNCPKSVGNLGKLIVSKGF